ncbi:unnamed protein product [Mytilus edulis]|uniref:ShKT domain-containing protein n=1 Tax=Mytilus edulis TaxID=6550 RepID=A0A8S3QGF5_MYTED|nr:unnamed protein product [Mytilus edulis]
MDTVIKSQYGLNWMDMEEILSEADYYKYFTESGSDQVSDNALRRACYVVRFMFADNKDVRTSYYKRYGRVAVIGASEGTTDIPEHSWLPKRLNERTRGLGATDYAPVCTAGEENASCFCKDKYFLEDIFVHEVAHGAHFLGAKYAIAGWSTKLINQFEDAQRTGLWNDTYAMNSSAEYFAEGVQSYFNVNTHLDKADGVHGPISNRKRLQEYDPVLYDLIHEVFPCKNMFLKRCESTRGKELEQELKMNCKKRSDEVNSNYSLSDVDFEDNNCTDIKEKCLMWALQNECKQNPEYMLYNCKKSCNACGDAIAKECKDWHHQCSVWASSGRCKTHSTYMFEYCKLSCDACESPRKNGDINCVDENTKCHHWAFIGECVKNQNYMLSKCKHSCNVC